LPQPSLPGEQPATFLADVQTRAIQSYFDLAARRSQAMTDYLRSLSSVRQPDDLVAVQMSFWNQMVNDYSSALTESLTPLAGAAAPARSKSAPPGSQAAA
jgi:hypothetical protein